MRFLTYSFLAFAIVAWTVGATEARCRGGHRGGHRCHKMGGHRHHGHRGQGGECCGVTPQLNPQPLPPGSGPPRKMPAPKVPTKTE
jgi:hypothetical protein